MSTQMKRTDDAGNVWFKRLTTGGKDVWVRESNQMCIKVVAAGSWDPSKQ